ncbi:MAG: flagellar biosynthesis anti-sigma factor FlgM [Gammaproteobacteria bacterium]
MPDDVSGNNSNHNHQTTQDSTREGDTTDSRPPKGTGKPDTVEVSEMTSQLKSLEQKLVKQPDVDQDRVNRMREAIHRGKYRVDSDRVANKMLGFEEDF